MLDKDPAELYQTETKALNLAVKRNLKRFPSDFMFQLTKEEFDSLRFQNETLDDSDLALTTEMLNAAGDNSANTCLTHLPNKVLQC